MKCRSEWQSPATAVLIKTSRGPGLLMLTSSITSGLLASYSTAAFMDELPSSLDIFDAARNAGHTQMAARVPISGNSGQWRYCRLDLRFVAGRSGKSEFRKVSLSGRVERR